MRSKFIIVVLFFLLLFLLEGCVDLWITFCIGFSAISVAWPCGRIEQEAEAFDSKGHYEARSEDFPCLLFAWSTVKTGHYLGHNSELCKDGQVATSLTRRW
jgi:hypothetical protein